MSFELKLIQSSPSLDNRKDRYLTKDKFLRYDEILAYRLQELIPDSIIKYETPEPGSKYRISETDLHFVYADDLHDILVIRNLETDKYVLVDFQDGPKHSKTLILNDNCIIQYSSMFLDMIEKDTTAFNAKCDLLPFTFFDNYPYLTRQFREEIREIRNSTEVLNPKMVFYGTLGDLETGVYCTDNTITGKREEVRKVVKVLKEKYPDLIDVKDREEKLERTEWWKLAATYSIALTVPGHPWCSREHEFWSLGIPTIASTYTCPLLFPLIHNKHYIDAGTTGKDLMDREIDQEQAADLIAERFLEVRDHREYLTKLASNAQERYDLFVYPEKAAEHLVSDIKFRTEFL